MVQNHVGSEKNQAIRPRKERHMYVRKTPPELKTGMIVVTREHKVGIVINDTIYGMGWWNPADWYFYQDKHLQTGRWKFESETEYNRGSETDIVAIYEVKSCGTYLEELMTEEKLKRGLED